MDPGDNDEPSRQELESRVEQLEETVSKMLPDRRGVIKGLGAAALGGAAVGASTGGASGQTGPAGQVGTPENPNDMFAWDLDVQNGATFNGTDIEGVGSLSTERTNNVWFADPADDAPGIQDIHDNKASPGDTIFLKPGVYEANISYSDGINIQITKNNITIDGSRQSIIRVPDGATNEGDGASVLDVPGDNCTVRNITIDGNWTNQTPIDELTDGENVFWSGDDGLLHNVQSIQACGEMVQFTGDRFRCIANYAYNDQEQSIHISGTANDSLVALNALDNTETGGTINFYGSDSAETGTGHRIIANVILRATTAGIKTYTGESAAQDITIAYNYVECNGTGAGVDSTMSNNASTDRHDGLQIHNNIFRNGGGTGIILEGDLTNFDISENIVADFGGNGIELRGNGPKTNGRIERNMIVDCNQNDTGGKGIYLKHGDFAVEDVLVVGNSIVSQSAPYHGEGITASGSGTGSYTDVYAHRNYIKNTQNSPMATAVLRLSGYRDNYGDVVHEAQDNKVLPSGSTTTTVSHGLTDTSGGVFDLTDVVITPEEGWVSSSATKFEVDDPTGNDGAFDIVVDNDPGQDVRFIWHVDSNE